MATHVFEYAPDGRDWRPVTSREYDQLYLTDCGRPAPAPEFWLATHVGSMGRMRITVPPKTAEEIALEEQWA
jgi:hypothetical protein